MNQAFMLRAADSMLCTPKSTAYFSAMAPLSGYYAADTELHHFYANCS